MKELCVNKDRYCWSNADAWYTLAMCLACRKQIISNFSTRLYVQSSSKRNATKDDRMPFMKIAGTWRFSYIGWSDKVEERCSELGWLPEREDDVIVARANRILPFTARHTRNRSRPMLHLHPTYSFTWCLRTPIHLKFSFQGVLPRVQQKYSLYQLQINELYNKLQTLLMNISTVHF